MEGDDFGHARTGEVGFWQRASEALPCCNSVQIVGLGDWNPKPARDAVKAALRRVQTSVANVHENMKLYRPAHSWLHAFTAFRLPSPLSAGATEAAKEAEDCLRRICREARFAQQRGIDELKKY